jgi:hypothetical protein
MDEQAAAKENINIILWGIQVSMTINCAKVVQQYFPEF